MINYPTPKIKSYLDLWILPKLMRGESLCFALIHDQISYGKNLQRKYSYLNLRYLSINFDN